MLGKSIGVKLVMWRINTVLKLGCYVGFFSVRCQVRKKVTVY